MLSWTTTNTDPNRRCTGRDAFFGVSPYPGDSPYPTIIQTNTGDSNLTKTYTLFCYNSNGVASQASSVSVTIKPPQPGRPVCIPSCPNSADVNCGNSLGRDSCEGSCPGTGTKCNNSSQSCQNGRCITPTTFACQIWAQQPVNPCTSSPCPVNLGANYSGPRSGIIQQCWSFNSSPAECNTSSGITSRNLTCGQSTSVRLVARDNAGSGPNQAECTTNITPTCSNDTAFNSTNGLVCLRGDNNCSTTGDGKWYAGWPAARHQCNYPGGTNHNITDQVYKDGICWREPETIEPSAGGVYAHGTFFDEGGRELIMPVVYYWMRGVPFCTQQVNGKCWAGGQPGFNTGTGPSPNSWEKSFYDPSPHHDRPVYISMMEWSPDYYLTDAYSFQTVAASNRRCTYRCNSSRPDCTGRRYQLYCKPNKDTPCGDTCDAECLEDECTSDLKCVRTETPQRISFGEVLSNPSYSESTTPVRVNYCTSHNGQRARINFHFKKAIYKISGTIFYDDNQDGIKDESERRIYDSGGTVVLNLSGTASSPSINLSSDNKPTGYSFDNLRGGNYLLRFTLPPGARLRITSPNPVSYPLFQPLNSDQVVNFGITDNPDAWIQTVGGDVHSNTLINTPGGP